IRLQDLSGEAYYSSGDLSYLTDSLFSVEYWGYYELLIFSNTLDVLKHDVFMVLAREMSRRSDFYKEIPNNRRLISSMLLNGYITCVERGKFLDALYFEKQLNQCFFTETEIYERLVFQYAQHLYHYKKEKDCKAIIEMRKCIAAMKLAGSNHLSKTYEGHLEKVLAEKS
ncbi:TPA: Rgg/GadR/MutR family transcriptional regulator, partial [Streptococcus equi subsp. zooepidemicus]|nr:Rgg/GadR/MutR family transcriptional regulator [Streptococcus equi subsp. zooepidemicus]